MQNIKLQLKAFGYSLVLGTIPTLLMYYLCLKLLALIEGSNLMQIGTFITFFSPVLAPVVAFYLYFYFFKKIEIPRNIWIYILIYSLLIAVINELYLMKFDSLWSGLGLIIGICNGIVLAVMSFIKSNNTSRNTE